MILFHLDLQTKNPKTNMILLPESAPDPREILTLVRRHSCFITIPSKRETKPERHEKSLKTQEICANMREKCIPSWLQHPII
jgi:hypothetical protein